MEESETMSICGGRNEHAWMGIITCIMYIGTGSLYQL